MIKNADMFVSLGSDEEVGHVLRAAGAKSDDLFSMADIPPTSLLALLQGNAAGFFELDNLFPYRPGMVWDTRYRIGLLSEMQSNNGQWIGSSEHRRDVHQREVTVRRSQLQQLRQRLADPDAVFLLKDGHGAPAALIADIASAIASAGGGKLVVIRTSSDQQSIGTVRKGDGIEVAYLDHFAMRIDLTNHSSNWFRILAHFTGGEPVETNDPQGTIVVRRRVSDKAASETQRPSPGAATELVPTISAAEMAYLVETAKAANVVLEFGSGGSTVALARAGVPLLWSVETDPYWYNRCADDPVVADAIENQRVNLLHIDVGDISEYGYPHGKTMALDWPRYHLAIWEKMPLPDLVVIDGRFRVACALQAALRCQMGTKIIVNDYAIRPEYAVIGDVLGAPRIVGSLAIFTNPRHLDPTRLGLALSAHFMDPR